MTYHLLDHVNAHNARELARTDLDARALGTLEWVPTTNMLYAAVMATFPLGRGHKISCGAPWASSARIGHDISVAGEIAELSASKRGYKNVCRPFDETHMIEAAAPHTPHDLHDDSEPDESALPLCYEVDGAGGKFANFRDVGEARPERVTPPNHGHGAKCVCIEKTWFGLGIEYANRNKIGAAVYTIENSDQARIRNADLYMSALAACPWCAGTGRIICDDERAGRVSPSHAAGGYAEWQRGTMEFSVTDHDGTRPLGRITNMRSVDGFVVGDIELEDGSVVVERLMRSPFSSSEIGDAEPATTERE